MRVGIIKLLLVCSLSGFFSSAIFGENEPLLLGETITQAKQQKMSPKQALYRLKEGNKRFLNNKSITRDYLKQAHQSSYGQYPFAIVLNCMDSRSVPEFFFDQGLADLFTLRVAGNVLNDDILGSMEFATKAVGARLIVVLGHSSCGAVAGSCQGVQLGYLTGVLDKIHPAVQTILQDKSTEQCKDAKVIDEMAKTNALNVVNEIQQKSSLIRELIKNKKIGIVAGMHNIKTGEVEFFEEARSVPE